MQFGEKMIKHKILLARFYGLTLFAISLEHNIKIKTF